MSGLRLACRLAWRAARRERLATFLTALLVALPVIGLVAAGTLARSATIPDRVQYVRLYGQAELTVSLAVSAAEYDGSQVAAVPGQPVPSPLSQLPRGSRVVTRTHRGSGALVDPRQGSRRSSVTLEELDYQDPLARGTLVQRSGRAPTGPGEVAITTYLAGRLHLHVGDTIALERLGAERVVATVDDPTYLESRALYGAPGAFSAVPATDVSYLVSLPAGTDRSAVHVSAPFSVDSPYFADDNGLAGRGGLNQAALALVLALLEASLTAGTAFAVGARRRRRDLALVAVNGGRASHTAGVVLANGLMCGVIGSVVGVGVGLLAARVGYPHLQNHSGQLLLGLAVDPRIVIGAAAFGLVSSLLSAGFPALLAARSSLRYALGKARGSSGTPGWITATGLGVFGLGIAVTVLAVRDASTGNGQQTTTALLGVVFVELGGVAVCPAMLGLIGRLGARLPALPRLALRDTARQRARSGPAVAAIAAAVSGAMAVSVYLASDHLRQVRDYQPPIPRNLVSVSLSPGDGPAPTLADISSVIGAQAAAHAARSHILTDQLGDFAGIQSTAQDNESALIENNDGQILVAGPELLKLLGASAEAQQALERGLMVVNGNGPRPTVRVEVGAGNSTSLSSPVAVVNAGWPDSRGRPSAVVSQATAEWIAASLSPSVRMNPTQSDDELWAPLSGNPSDSQRTALQARASDVGLSMTVDAGPGSTDALASLALLGVAGIFSLVVTAAATVLAAAESQTELSILGAVGATGFTRRLFTAAQGSTTALLGGVLGIAIGLVPGIAVVQASLTHLPLVVPWQPFAAFLIGLPLLAAVGGLIFGRSSLPSVTRTL